MKKSLLFLPLLFTQILFSQIELVNNSWPNDPQGHKYYPDAQAIYVSRARNADGSGQAGIPFTYTVKQYAGQGFHTHETEHGTFISRPDPVWISDTSQGIIGASGTTGADGYAKAILEFNYFAGWYTVCVNFKSPVTQATIYQNCVNNNTRYYTRTLNNPDADVDLVRYSGGRFPYFGTDGNPLASNINAPQNLHQDFRHVTPAQSGNPGGGEGDSLGYATRWVTNTTNLLMVGASSKYKQDTQAAGISSVLDVTRGSLPDGGIYDNDVAGITPSTGNGLLDWSTRVQEEHSHGNELDILVPPGTQSRNLAFAALYQYNCRPGVFQPNGVHISAYPPDSYWVDQGIMHVACGKAPPSKGTTAPPRPR